MSEPLLVTGSPQTNGKTVHTGIGQVNHPFLNRQNQGAHQNGAMPHYGGGAEKCARCSKSVYLAEKKVGAGRSFHTSCFSCQTCNRKLDATTLSEHKGEIFCKTCYTRQFGVHGLVSGVTMTTENPVREVRHSRRSSYGSDLDAPVITHEKTRPRAHSNDNSLRGETSAIVHDESPKMFPWRNDVIPEQRSPPNNHGVNNLVEKEPARPKSQIGFEKVVESTYSGEYHSNKYAFDNEKPSYSNGTSAVINIPVISPTKRVETSARYEERSPSPTTRDVYQRKNSHERQPDISENFARLTLSEINAELYANEHIMTNKIATDNPIIKPKYVLQTSQENKRASSNTNHSRDSSPSTNTQSNRSPSPTSGYGSSGIHGEHISRDSTSSPPSAYVPQHDYVNARTSDRHPSSPSKTNLFSSPPVGGKYSTIGALIKPHRPVSQLSAPHDDEYQN